MKIALVHDYLSEAGGAERVLKVLSEMYPDAVIYTAFCKKSGSAYPLFKDKVIVESKLAWLLKIGRFYSYLRFLLPWVWKSIDLTEYDLVITSCSGYIARGFKTKPSTKVVAYCHTPPRWLYGYDTPTGAQSKWWGKAFLWVVGPFVRYFDFCSAQKVGVWIANSNEVAKRIAKYYRLKSEVVYPPVEIDQSRLSDIIKRKGEYYLMISRIVGGKGIAEASETFAKIGKELKIVGEAIDLELASKVTSLGRVDDAELAELYAGAVGFVAFSKDEDFGMTVVESMMYGTPVLAFNGGGYKETVIDGINGILINDLELESVEKGVKRMESKKWDSKIIQKSAQKYERARFEKEMRKVIANARIA